MRQKTWVIILAVLTGLLQLFPSKRPQNVVSDSGDLLLTGTVPDSIANLLKTSCYDCHSNQTHYRWYSYVAPVKWLIVRDVREGRAKLNFSEWGSTNNMDKAGHLSDMIDEVKDGKMPMKVYTYMHPRAKLDERQRKMLVDWANSCGERLFE